MALTCTGYFMVILDATVTNVALPSIGRGLHGGVTGLQWVQVGGVLGVAVLARWCQLRPHLIGGLRAGLVLAGCAFLAGAALVSGLARESGDLQPGPRV